MVIVLQVCILLIAVFLRGRMLFGSHLTKEKDSDTCLNFIRENKYGQVISRHVGLTIESGLPFIIRHERRYHRLLKVLGLASELQFNDAAFDAKYFISTDFPHQLDRAKHTGNLLAHLQQLFALPVKSLHVTPTKIWCVIAAEDRNKELAHFDTHRKILSNIAQSVAHTPYSISQAAPARRARLLAFSLICLHMGLLVLGILGAPTSLIDSKHLVDHHALVIASLLNGGLSAALWLALIIILLRNTSWIGWVLTDFVLCGFIGIMLSSMAITREANIHLAQPTAQHHEQPITQRVCIIQCSQRCGKHCTRNKTYRYDTAQACELKTLMSTKHALKTIDPICRSHAWIEYELHVANWNTQGDYVFTPNPALFEKATIGSAVQIPVNAGALGLEWVDFEAISMPQ